MPAGVSPPRATVAVGAGCFEDGIELRPIRLPELAAGDLEHLDVIGLKALVDRADRLMVAVITYVIFPFPTSRCASLLAFPDEHPTETSTRPRKSMNACMVPSSNLVSGRLYSASSIALLTDVQKKTARLPYGGNNMRRCVGTLEGGVR